MDILIPTLVLACMGAVFGLGLSYAAKKFAINTDERIARIRDLLPGANCGACGYVGCDNYAAAIVNEGEGTGKCPAGGQAVSSAIAEIMGIAPEQVSQKVARVMCNGKCSVSREKYYYVGINNCAAAAQMYAGHKQCSYGCLGHGTCQNVCRFGAIVVSGGVARVIEDNCVGCGLCVKSCPKNLIELVPKDKVYAVLCKSRDRGPVTKRNCDVGCIGCTKCQKACGSNAITIVENLAKIDPEKCSNCGKCAEECPTMAIRRTDYDETLKTTA